MTIDRRAAYYAASADERAADELAWLNRFMRGMAVKRRVRMGKQTATVLTLRRKQA